jgi:hypothetical protein
MLHGEIRTVNPHASAAPQCETGHIGRDIGPAFPPRYAQITR